MKLARLKLRRYKANTEELEEVRFEEALQFAFARRRS
jgi:hypothetical protein